MLSQLQLKLLPGVPKELTGDVAMHNGDKMLKLMSVGLQLSNLQAICNLALFQPMERLFQHP